MALGDRGWGYRIVGGIQAFVDVHIREVLPATVDDWPPLFPKLREKPDGGNTLLALVTKEIE